MRALNLGQIVTNVAVRARNLPEMGREGLGNGQFVLLLDRDWPEIVPKGVVGSRNVGENVWAGVVGSRMLL